MANRTFQYQGLFEPLSEIKELVTVDKWVPNTAVPQAAWAKAALFSLAVMIPGPGAIAQSKIPFVDSFMPNLSIPVPPTPPRAYLYPVTASPLSEAKEATTVDRWFKETQRPRWDVVRNQHLYPIEAVDPISPNFPERVSVDKWNQPVASRPADRPRLPHLYQSLALIELPTPDAPDIMPGMNELPKILPPSYRHLYQQATVDPISPTFPERMTADKWYSYLPDQVRDKQHLQYLYPVVAVDPWAIANEVGYDAWYQPITQPLRDAVRTQYLHPVISPHNISPTVVERTTPDKWLPSLPDQVRGPQRLQYLQSQGAASPEPIVGDTGKFVDAWGRSTNTPVWDRLRQQHLAPVSTMPTRFANPERITIDKWHPTYPDMVNRADNRGYLYPLGTRVPFLPLPGLDWQPSYPSLLNKITSSAHLAPVSTSLPFPRTSSASLDHWFMELQVPVRSAPRFRYLYPDETVRSMMYLATSFSFVRVTGSVTMGPIVSGSLS